MLVMAKKIRGGKFTTQKEYENVIDRDKKVNRILTNVVIVNLGTDEIHVLVNDGDELPLEPGETLSLGNLVVDKLVVKEKNATVKYLGVE
jgi:hypothetical protein